MRAAGPSRPQLQTRAAARGSGDARRTAVDACAATEALPRIRHAIWKKAELQRGHRFQQVGRKVIPVWIHRQVSVSVRPNGGVPYSPWSAPQPSAAL